MRYFTLGRRVPLLLHLLIFPENKFNLLMKLISNDTSIFTNKTMGFYKVGIKCCVKLFISRNMLIVM